MPLRTDTFDLAGLHLSAGAGRRIDLHVAIVDLLLGGEHYRVDSPVPITLDASRTTGGGYALRIRFEANLTGPCMRCLEAAAPLMTVDAREISQPSEDLDCPYLDGDVLDVQAWAHDALALALPDKLLCRPDCAGLCPVCGADLNRGEPGHEHPREPDARWAKLSEIRFE